MVVKLPIVIQYGEEAEWDEEERARVLGEEFVFGCQDEDKDDIEGETDETVSIIDVEEGEEGVKAEVDSVQEDEPEIDENFEATEVAENAPIMGIDGKDDLIFADGEDADPSNEEDKGENNKANI